MNKNSICKTVRALCPYIVDRDLLDNADNFPEEELRLALELSRHPYDMLGDEKVIKAFQVRRGLSDDEMEIVIKGLIDKSILSRSD